MQGPHTPDPAVTLPEGASNFERLAGSDRAAREAAVERYGRTMLESLPYNWDYLARDGQRPPGGDWRTWLIMAGRGFGKTRAGAEWIRSKAETHGQARIALVAATFNDARAVMVEGESGLLAISPTPPKFEPSLRRLTWESGAQATLYSAGDPETLRGPQHHFAWCDEIAKWPKANEAWDNLAFGLRLGSDPRTVATTTPRATALLRRLEALIPSGQVRRTGGSTRDNRAHLAPGFVADIYATYQGTLTGRQELDGELIDDAEGALWTRALIERCRAALPPGDVARVAIGVDPPAGASASSDACGIVAVALGGDGRGYVIEDASVQGRSPEGWARAVAGAAARHNADRVVAEANNGGAMVESVLRAADAGLAIRLVHAAHGKVARAEPVAALYERGRVAHVGAFPHLEDEMAGLIVGGEYAGPGNSPDRADALVWALTELLLGPRAARPGIRSL